MRSRDTRETRLFADRPSTMVSFGEGENRPRSSQVERTVRPRRAMSSLKLVSCDRDC